MSVAKSFRFKDIIGCSQALRQVTSMLKRIADTPLNTILFLGETGTGKDLLAKVLHGPAGVNGQFLAVGVCET